MTAPRATVLLLNYNTGARVGAAIAGALAQTVPCRIVVSDDASPDDSWLRIQQALDTGHGPHQVRAVRNPDNLGLGAHLSARMAEVDTDIVVQMAGDDVSYPHRVERLLAAFDADPRVMVAGSAYDKVDDAGAPLGPDRGRVPEAFDIRHFASAGRFTTLIGASMAWRREIFDRIGPLHAQVEDNALTMRGALLGRGVQLPERLLRYTAGAGNLSSWVFAKGDGSQEAFQRRYRRLLRMYRDVADDLDGAIARVVEEGAAIDPAVLRAARQVARMYRLEAEQREAILERPRREWIAPLWQGLSRPGLRRKSAERAVKLLLPRKWFGSTR